MFLTRLTTGLLVGTALAVPALSQGKPFKHALPANTLAFLTLPDLDTSIGEFQSTAFAKMWREDEVQDFAKDAMKLAEAKWSEGLGRIDEMHKAGAFPVGTAEILKMRVHSFSAALTGLDVAMGEFGPEPKLGVLLHMECGESAGTMRKLAKMGLGQLVAQAPAGTNMKSAQLDGGGELITVSREGQAMGLNVAFVGNGVLIGTLTADVKACAEAILGQKTLLPVSERYKATARRLDTAGAEIEAYVDMHRVIDVVISMLSFAQEMAPNWPPQLQVERLEKALTEMGMRSVHSVGLTSKYENGKAITRSFAYSPKDDRKGMMAGDGKPIDMKFLKWVPADVASISAMSIDMQGIHDGLIAAVKAYNPDQADQLLGMLKQQEEAVGISLKDDLFGVFGSQAVWWSMGVSNFMSAPEGALLLQVKDQDRLLRTLNKMAEMSGGMVEFPSSERRGVKTWRMEVNTEAIPPQAAVSFSMLQPCFAFKDGYMVMALASGDVRKALKRMDREDDPKDDIRSNKEFSTYLGQIQQQIVSSFAWTDWKLSFENLYSVATSALALAVSADEVPFDLTLLPEAETLSQHLFSSMAWSTTMDDGFASTTVSPMGAEMVALGGVAALGGSLALFGMRAEAAPARVRAAPGGEVDKAKEVPPPPVKKTDGDVPKKDEVGKDG